MSNIPILLNTFHRFTPKGQELLLRELKANRKLLDKPYGYFDVAKKLSFEDKIDPIQKESLMPIRDMLVMLADNYLKKIVISNEIKQNTAKNIAWITELTNRRGKAEFSLSKHFDKKKQAVLDILHKNKMTKTAEEFNKLETPENISDYSYLFDIDKLSEKYYLCSFSHIFKILADYIKFKIFKQKNKDFNLYYYQKWDKFIEIQKALLSRSKDKRVRRIEYILKQKYNFKYANLYDYENAVNVLKAVKIASKNNVELPQQVLVTPFYSHQIKGTNVLPQNCIIINADSEIHIDHELIKSKTQNENEKKFLKGYNKLIKFYFHSTFHPEHIALHEIMHGENYKCSIEKIPEWFKTIVDHLGTDVQLTRRNMEIRAELRTKELLDGLEKQEEELLDFLTIKE